MRGLNNAGNRVEVCADKIAWDVYEGCGLFLLLWAGVRKY